MQGVSFAPTLRMKNPIYKSSRERSDAVSYIEEEVKELHEALIDKDEVEVVDAICDIIFTTLGVAAKAGVSHIVENAFDEVCRSNDTKLLGGGEKYEGTNKTGKGKFYKEPRIAEMISQSDELRGLLLEKEDKQLIK